MSGIWSDGSVCWHALRGAFSHGSVTGDVAHFIRSITGYLL